MAFASQIHFLLILQLSLIDTAEMFDGCVYHHDGGFLLADLSINEDEIRRRLQLLRLADPAGGTDDAPVAFEQGLCYAQTNAAGSAIDDRDSLFGCSHRMSFFFDLVLFKMKADFRSKSSRHLPHGSGASTPRSVQRSPLIPMT